MTYSHRQAEYIREAKHRWPYGWWILPAVIFGALVWMWIIRRLVETFWGLK